MVRLRMAIEKEAEERHSIQLLGIQARLNEGEEKIVRIVKKAIKNKKGARSRKAEEKEAF